MCTFRVWRSREVGRGLPMKYRVSCLLSDRFSPLVKKISSCFPDETRTESSFSCLPKENLSILEQHLFNIHPTLVSFVEAVPRACATTPRQTIFRSCIVFFFVCLHIFVFSFKWISPSLTVNFLVILRRASRLRLHDSCSVYIHLPYLAGRSSSVSYSYRCNRFLTCAPSLSFRVPTSFSISLRLRISVYDLSTILIPRCRVLRPSRYLRIGNRLLYADVAQRRVHGSFFSRRTSARRRAGERYRTAVRGTDEKIK